LLCLFFSKFPQFTSFSSLGQVQNNGQGSVPQGWNPQSQRTDEAQAMGIGQYRSDVAQVPYSFPQHSHIEQGNSGGLSTSSGAQIQHAQTNNQQNNYSSSGLLFPVNFSRGRSKSDTSLHPIQWNTNASFMSQDDSALDDSAGTVNMNDVLPGHQQSNSAGPLQASFGNIQPPHLSHNFTFGPPSSSQHLANSYLSPDISTSIRRSKSDAGSGSRPGHRQSRSEDVRSTQLLFPPPSQHTQELLRQAQYLHPQETAIRGHARRASSGSRGGVMDRPGSWSNSSSARPSPYPSPSASPRVRYDELPNVALSGRQAPLLQPDHGYDDNGFPGGQDYSADDAMNLLPESLVVSKQNVTTGRTANASHKRRKGDANFKCPIPGCGSTFTRSFNLKGAFLYMIYA
jgi:hypothetical protein